MGLRTFDKGQSIRKNIFMRKNILLAMALVAALTLGVGAQDISFDALYRNSFGLSAVPVSVPAPVAAVPVEAAAAAAPAATIWRRRP